MDIYDSRYIDFDIYMSLYFALIIENIYPFQVYVGSKSTIAEGTNFGSTRGTENEVTEMEVCTLGNEKHRIIFVSLYYIFC